MSEKLVRDLAMNLGGKIEEMQRLPDGSGFAMMSMPLPADHWLTKESAEYEPPPMPFRLGTEEDGTNILSRIKTREEFAKKILLAGRYACRAATMNGKEMDFDPDALLQNLVVGMLGYWTPDGLSPEIY